MFPITTCSLCFYVYTHTLPSLSLHLPQLCSSSGCPLISTLNKTQFNDTFFHFIFSQVARTITNMQQQIQQHQRQLYQALLMKQQQLPSHSSSSSAGLHLPSGPGKSTLDPFTGPHQAPGLADTLHTKEPPSSPNTYSTYPLCESSNTVDAS